MTKPKWTKTRRRAFNEAIDLVLAMTDLAEEVEGKDSVGVIGRHCIEDRQHTLSDFQEAELFDRVGGHFAIAERDNEQFFFQQADPKTDLPPRFDVSACVLHEDTVAFHKLKRMQPRDIRGQRLLSPYPAILVDRQLSLETGFHAGTSRIVFWVRNKWVAVSSKESQIFIRKKSGIGEPGFAVIEEAPDKVDSTCRILTGIEFSRDLQWRVVIRTPGGNSFSMITDPAGAAAAFRDRTADTKSGRRSALRNWVKEHSRKKRHSNEDRDDLLEVIHVRQHLRGRIPFTWQGLDCEIVPAPFDVRLNDRIRHDKEDQKATK